MSVEIKRVDKHYCLDFVGIFIELEQYYFGDKAASELDLANYLSHQVFSEFSGVKVIAAVEHDKVLGLQLTQ